MQLLFLARIAVDSVSLLWFSSRNDLFLVFLCWSVNSHQTPGSSVLTDLPVKQWHPKPFYITLLLYVSWLSARKKAGFLEGVTWCRRRLTPSINQALKQKLLLVSTGPPVNLWMTWHSLGSGLWAFTKCNAIQMHTHVHLCIYIRRVPACACMCFRQARYGSIIARAAEFGPSCVIAFFLLTVLQVNAASCSHGY